MTELELRGLLKIYPFIDTAKRLFGRKKAMELLEEQKKKPYLTNEGVIALQKFSLVVEKGEFLVLLGPSGCGKSSLIRMIAGLEEVTAGEVVMDGKVINDVHPEDRDMAMVFQNYSLYPHFTVYENIAFPLKNQHIPREELDAVVLETAELLGLTPWLSRRPKELSGGQMQRVALGRALVRRPRIFLMDEPFSNLDVPLRRKMRQELGRIHKKLGTTFIYVTHDQEEAFALGTRIVLMRDGMIEQVGTPQQLYTRPVSLYAASFVGTPPMNFAEHASLCKTGDTWQVKALGATVPLPAGRTHHLSERDNGREVIFGIRPVHLVPSEDGQGIETEIDYVEPLESECILHLKTDGAELVAVVAINPSLPLPYVAGDRIYVNPVSRRIYLFDPETGESVV